MLGVDNYASQIKITSCKFEYNYIDKDNKSSSFDYNNTYYHKSSGYLVFANQFQDLIFYLEESIIIQEGADIDAATKYNNFDSDYVAT